ncbi:MFS transporter [Streptomyces sp. NPDC086023]|uniref:MFS transporter n=1 Tax=Streptomyces sp. NPDC086023 TaxID=3365746 RepID=UPI0037CD2DC5
MSNTSASDSETAAVRTTGTVASKPAVGLTAEERAEQFPFATTLAVLALAAVVVVSQGYVAIPLMPDFGEAWGVSQGSAAWATTAFSAAYACASLASGFLADRYGRRNVVVASIAVMAVMTALVPLASDLVTGSLLRALQGSMAGVFTPVVYIYLSDRVPTRRLALALTVVSCALGVALCVGQVMAQILGSSLGWQSVFWLVAPLLAVVAAVAWKVLLPDEARDLPPRDAKGPSPVAGVLRNGSIVALFVASLGVLGSLTAIYTGVQLYGPAEVVGNHDTMLALRASALPAMVGAVFLAPVMGRLSALTRTVIGFAVGAVGLLAAALYADSVIGLGVSLFVYVLAISTVSPALVQAVGTSAGPARATATAIYSFILNGGVALGAQIPQGMPGLSSLALLLAAALVVGIGLVGLAARSARRHAAA